jgi:hypothetical protein
MCIVYSFHVYASIKTTRAELAFTRQCAASLWDSSFVTFSHRQNNLPEELAPLHALVRATRILQSERFIQHGQ